MVRGGNKKGGSRKTKKKSDDEPEYVGTIEPPQVEPELQLQDDHEKEDQQHQSQADTCQMSKEKVVDDEEPEGELELLEENSNADKHNRKRKRGPTKMNYINKDPNMRIHVDYTAMGDPNGDGSVKLSSYLGILAREHVHITLERWTKLPEESKTLLMKSIQVIDSFSFQFANLNILSICLHFNLLFVFVRYYRLGLT